MWHRVLVFACLLACLVPASALANPIRVNFTVLGAPTDPVLAGTTGTGVFVFDSSIIPRGGGQIWANYPPGLEVSFIGFDWDGQQWSTSDADCAILTFAADGTLVSWSLQANVSPGYVYGGTTDFAIDVGSSSQTFSYGTPRLQGVQAGTVVSWNTTVLPIIVGAWLSAGAQLALDSFGRVYLSYNPAQCPDPLGSVTVLGNLFGGPAPSPVIDLTLVHPATENVVYATLQNGDIWRMCPPDQGAPMGNIFVSSGVAAVGTTSPPAVNLFSASRPNPFNPSTKIPYSFATGGRVIIQVFDVAGRLVKSVEDSVRPAGHYVAQWNGRKDDGGEAASGTYFGRITFPDGAHSEQKLTIVR